MENPLKTVALKQHYFTPAEANIPKFNKQIVPTHNASSLILNYKLLKEKQDGTKLADDNFKELDGFLILESSGMGFPEDVRQIVLADRQLKVTVTDDFCYFTEVIYVDVSENFLNLEPFGAFPKLVELKMACNNINKLENIIGFDSLMYLDLSYNKLSIHSIPFLESIPNLKELDLCGNSLGGLPSDLKGFTNLEKILLEYNKIDSPNIFLSLASIPNLRQVSLANNFLSTIPIESCIDGNLKFLEILDLAFNYFSEEDKIECLVALPRLVTLMLYGNPLLGPSGEDPMFIYIEDLIQKAYDCRNGSNIKDIDFVTEIPRRRILKKGQQLGRLAAYRDFSIKQIDTTISSKSTREWRKIGSETLFAEAVAAVAGNSNALKKSLLESSTSAKEVVIPDFTFLTSVGGPTNNNPYSNDEQINQTDKIADDIMKQVAEEMGLINSAELLYLRDRAKLPYTATQYDDLFNEHLPPVDSVVQDKIPSEVIRRGNITDPGTLSKTAQPVTLKTAMKALSNALRQPLTDYGEVYDSKQYGRATMSSKNYQKPRRLEPTRKGLMDISESEFDKKINKYKRPGLPESLISQQLRSTNRQENLGKIEQVLDNLNDNTNQFVNANPTYNLNAKDTLKEYKKFIKPYPAGIKNLMEMIDEATGTE